MMDIGTLGGKYAQAYAINDTGFITGTAQTPRLLRRRPTRSSIGRSVTALQQCGIWVCWVAFPVTGWRSTTPTMSSAIRHLKRTTSAFTRSCTWQEMIDLGSLGGNGDRWGSDVSEALGVNKLDQVVGYSYLPGGRRNAPPASGFSLDSKWHSGGKMVNLNKLVTHGEPTTCSSRRQQSTTTGRSWPTRMISRTAVYARCC